MVDERTAHYQQQTKNQIHSVDNNLMRENDPEPLFNERKSKVTFEKAINLGVYDYGISYY